MDSALPKKVLHVMNAANGGSACSALGLIQKLRSQFGIGACAVCDCIGRREDFEELREAVRGELVVRPLYWWNKKIRTAAWRRPFVELRQMLQTGMLRGSVNDTVAAARSFGADFVHSNTSVTLEGGETARRLRLPHVWHLRELIGPRQPYRFRYEGRAWGDYVCRRASMVIANSHRTAECIRDWLPANRLVTVYNGIDLGRFEPRSSYGNRQPLVVGMVGSLGSTWKRHDWFVEAAGLVARELPIEFRLYGVVPERATGAYAQEYLGRLRQLADQYSLGGRLRFMGFTAYDPAPEIDIMLHTSPKESFGRAVVEGMATGAPIVGVCDGGVGEVVVHGETGILVNPGDVKGLAEAVERLAADPDLCRRLGTAGRMRAENFFSLDACASGVADAYRGAIADPGGPLAGPRAGH